MRWSHFGQCCSALFIMWPVSMNWCQYSCKVLGRLDLRVLLVYCFISAGSDELLHEFDVILNDFDEL